MICVAKKENNHMWSHPTQYWWCVGWIVWEIHQHTKQLCPRLMHKKRGIWLIDKSSRVVTMFTWELGVAGLAANQRPGMWPNWPIRGRHSGHLDPGARPCAGSVRGVWASPHGRSSDKCSLDTSADVCLGKANGNEMGFNSALSCARVSAMRVSLPSSHTSPSSLRHPWSINNNILHSNSHNINNICHTSSSHPYFRQSHQYFLSCLIWEGTND